MVVDISLEELKTIKAVISLQGDKRSAEDWIKDNVKLLVKQCCDEQKRARLASKGITSIYALTDEQIAKL